MAAEAPNDLMTDRMMKVIRSLRPHAPDQVGKHNNTVTRSDWFNNSDIPESLRKDLLQLQNETNWKKNVVMSDIFRMWYGQKMPNIHTKQDCTDMISGITDMQDTVMNEEVHFGAKLAMIAYALPGFIPYLSTRLHMSNLRFTRYIESMVAENTFPAFEDMDRIVSGDTLCIDLPADNQIAGLYIRTPSRVWGKTGRPVDKIPKWDNRSELLQKVVIGNVNVYVLRQNHKTGFDLYLLFRGTSNEFNGIPQYGSALQNTQLFRIPQYNIEQNRFVATGSETEPLFYFYYSQMIEDVKPHIYECLKRMGIESDQCRRVLVSGHSMGGGLVTTFAYVSHIDKPAWWTKFSFRAYASPYCCNDAAVKILEKWIVESNQMYKFIEIINTDDLVNVQYLFAHKDGMQESLRMGTASFAAWLVDQHHILTSKGSDIMEKALRIMQLYPELSLTTFLNGASTAQGMAVPNDKKVAFRLGQSHSEIKQWGSAALNHSYNRSLNMIFCKRRIEWDNEGLGRSHSSYIGINMNLFWSPLRAWENKMYRYYSTHGIKKNNELRIIGLFSKVDRCEIEPWIKAYKVPLWVPSKSLIQNTIRFQQNSRTVRK